MSALSKIASMVSNARETWSMYSQHLPLVFQSVVSLPCAVTLLGGTMRGSGQLLTVLYVGRRRNYPYLLQTLFEEVSVVDEEHSTILTYSRHMRRMEADADVTIVDIGWPYHGIVNRRRDFLVMPDWINMSMSLAEEWDDVVRSFRHTTRNNDLRLIRRNEYRCEPSCDVAVIRDFYDEMYLPFIRHRHQLDSVEAPREHVMDRAQEGSLLRIYKGEKLVVAGVVYPEDDVLYFLWMGISADCLDQPPEAAVSALYFFGIRYAFDNGLEAVDFTGNRAFLADGAYRFKRKWGAMIEDSFSPSSILVRPHSGNEKAALFCQQFPMLVRRGGALEAIFLYYKQDVDDSTLKKIDSQFGCEGIDRISVLAVSETGESDSRVVDGQHCEKHVVSCGLAEFAAYYASVSWDVDRKAR